MNASIIFFYVSYFILYLLCLILVVSYFTLLERKLLASLQSRTGPDKLGFFGILQPIVDAVKLLVKEFVIPNTSFPILFFGAPIITLIISLTIWLFIPLTRLGSLIPSEFSLLWVLAISSLNVISIFLSGYASNNRYALLGSIRAIAQFVSYEIVMAILVLPIVFVSGSLNITTIASQQIFFSVSNFAWMLPNAFIFFICILAETNRAPFDLAEAEAELVAGYNVEYSSLAFAFFFLAEYLSILSMSTLFVLLFCSGWTVLTDFIILDSLFLFCKVFCVIFTIIWTRATLPRIRYDVLMMYCWKFALFFSLAFFILFIVSYFFWTVLIC